MKKKLTNNLGLKLASLALAFVLWVLVVQIEDPQDSVTFNNVQVKLINAELLEQEGKVYEILEDTNEARVTVYAPKSVIGQIRETDIVAEADMSKLTDINTIAINYYSQNPSVERVEGNREVVRLSVEDKAKKWIRLVGNTIGEVAQGYMIYSTSLDQTNIEIIGPESAVSQVEYAAVDMGVSGATNNLSANIDIQLLDADGNVVDQSNIEKNVNSAYMTVEVLATKEVPVELLYVGEAAEGYLATGVIDTSMATVKLAGRASVLESINAITVPDTQLDISGASDSLVKTIDLDAYLPDNVRFADKSFNGRINVTVHIEPIVSEEIDVPIGNISFINMPDGFDVEWPEDVTGYNLTISGLWEYVNAVQPETITGYVDVAAYMEKAGIEQLKVGTHIVPVTFVLSENITVDEELTASVLFFVPDEE